MKLNLGNNLRTLRKNANMTQEQLADKLGVSYQAVSRWENSTTYPDLEFIPVIAQIFDVSSDTLLGMPDEKKEVQAEEVFTKLAKTTYEADINTELVIDLIREIRRNYLKSKHFWNFWLSTKSQTFCMPEILPEVRLTVETILDGDYEISTKNGVIRHFSGIEGEEYLEAFLEKYATTEDLSKNALLYNRYMRFGPVEKCELMRQKLLFHHIDELIGNSNMWRRRGEVTDFETYKKENRMCLQLLHNVCAITSDEKHPITGNGEVDIWVEPRLWMGVYEVGILSNMGDKERALIALEDVTCLLEKTMAITSPVQLNCSSPWLDKIVWTAEESWHQITDAYILRTEDQRIIWIHNQDGCCYCIYPSIYYEMLTATQSEFWYTKFTHYLDSIKNDERFQQLTERVRSLIITRPRE